jgi:hypothetical protein
MLTRWLHASTETPTLLGLWQGPVAETWRPQTTCGRPLSPDHTIKTPEQVHPPIGMYYPIYLTT